MLKMGWLIVIVGLAVWISVAWIPDYLDEKRRKEQRQLAEERKFEFEQSVSRLVSHYPSLMKEMYQFNLVTDKFKDTILRAEHSGLFPKKEEKQDEKVIRFPKDGDFVGKCPKCKLNNLILRGGKSGYIKCMNYPNCDYLRNYDNLDKLMKKRIESLFFKDFERAYK